jgi:hypothetical protein
MPKGIKNGSDELAKAYIHGRIDATRDILIADLDKKLERELNQWCFRFALNPMEIKQDLGALPVTAQVDSVPSSGMQYAAKQRESHAVATLEVAERAYGVRPSLSPSSGNPQDAPNQIDTPTPTSKNSSKIKAYWAAMSPEQKAAVMRDKLILTSKKRKLLPMEKMRLVTLTNKAGNTVAPQSKKAARAADQAAMKARGLDALSDAERRAKQVTYVARAKARKKGTPLPPLPEKGVAA